MIMKEKHAGFLLPTISLLSPYISLPLIPRKKKMRLCITNIVPAKLPDMGHCSLCCSQSAIKWWKRRLENLPVFPRVICVSPSTDSYSLQKSQKPRTCPASSIGPSQSRNVPAQGEGDKAGQSLCRWRSLVFLHSTVQLTHLVHTKRQLCCCLITYVGGGRKGSVPGRKV